MNILSFDIFVCGSSTKKRNLKKYIFEICLIQETKIQVMEENDIFSLRGVPEVELTSKPSQEYFRGLLIMWKVGLCNPIFSFKG